MKTMVFPSSQVRTSPVYLAVAPSRWLIRLSLTAWFRLWTSGLITHKEKREKPAAPSLSRWIQSIADVMEGTDSRLCRAR